VDRDTKIRQALFLTIVLISLCFTAMLKFDGNHWLLPAIASYVVMAFALYRGTKMVVFVPYNKDNAQA